MHEHTHISSPGFLWQDPHGGSVGAFRSFFAQPKRASATLLATGAAAAGAAGSGPVASKGPAKHTSSPPVGGNGARKRDAWI